MVARTSKRSPRALEKRSQESRVTEMRPPIVYSEESAFNVPQSIRDAHPELSFAYIPYVCGGKELHENFDNAVYNRAFTPVTASQFPALSRRHALSPFERKEEDSLIKHGGQVLMVRSTDAKQAEDKVFDEKIARQNYIRDMHSQNPSARPFADERKWGV